MDSECSEKRGWMGKSAMLWAKRKISAKVKCKKLLKQFYAAKFQGRKKLKTQFQTKE